MDLLHPNVRGEIPLPTQALLDAGFESSKTVDWNQLLYDANFNNIIYWKTASANTLTISNNILTMTTSQKSAELYQNISTKVSGHKYLCLSQIMADNDITAYFQIHSAEEAAQAITIPAGNDWTDFKQIKTLRLTADAAGIITTLIDVKETNIKYKYMYIIDLTQIFGAGNEPTDINDPRIKEIESYALNHPDYTTSKQALLQEYINWRNVRGYIYDINSLVEAGFETRDNVVMWEKGNIDANNGSELPWSASNGAIRTNYIKVDSSRYTLTLNHTLVIRVSYYDANYEYISRSANTLVNDTFSFTPPANTSYIRVASARNSQIPDTYPSEIPGLIHTVTGGDLINSNIIKWRNVRGNLYTLGSLLPYIKHPIFNTSVKVSDLEWVHLGTEQYPHLFRALLSEKVLGNTNVYCDLYTTSSGSVVEDMLDYEIKGATGSRYVYIKDPRFSKADGSDLKAYLGDTKIWYEKE